MAMPLIACLRIAVLSLPFQPKFVLNNEDNLKTKFSCLLQYLSRDWAFASLMEFLPGNFWISSFT